MRAASWLAPRNILIAGLAVAVLATPAAAARQRALPAYLTDPEANAAVQQVVDKIGPTVEETLGGYAGSAITADGLELSSTEQPTADLRAFIDRERGDIPVAYRLVTFSAADLNRRLARLNDEWAFWESRGTSISVAGVDYEENTVTVWLRSAQPGVQDALDARYGPGLFRVSAEPLSAIAN